MFVSPKKYVEILNRCYVMIRSSRRTSTERYARWGSRVQGLLLVFASFLVYYAVWLAVKEGWK